MIASPPKADRADAKSMTDAAYLAFVLAQMFKLGVSLLAKRWPEVR